jgi:hypothetical protein
VPVRGRRGYTIPIRSKKISRAVWLVINHYVFTSIFHDTGSHSLGNLRGKGGNRKIDGG